MRGRLPRQPVWLGSTTKETERVHPPLSTELTERSIASEREEPPDDFEPDGPRQVTLQMRLLGPRDSLVLRVQRGDSPRNAEQAAQIEAEPIAQKLNRNLT